MAERDEAHKQNLIEINGTASNHSNLKQIGFVSTDNIDVDGTKINVDGPHINITNNINVQSSPHTPPKENNDSAKVSPALSEPLSSQSVKYQTKRANLPFIPRGFVGRDEKLQQLHEQLRPGISIAITEQPRTAITGMGGIGKTQLAIYYAYQHLEDYETICWVDAEGKDITANFAALAQNPLALKRPPTETIEDTAKAVRDALTNGGPHLLIFDNVEYPESCIQYIPLFGKTRILMTTRRRDIQGVQSLYISYLSNQEAFELLSNGKSWNAEECKAAEDLCQELGRLTLALAVASRILNKPGRSPSSLLKRIRNQGPLEWSKSASPDHLFNTNPSLAQLFETSVALLDLNTTVDRLAIRMLMVGGWFAPVAIPPHLLEDAAYMLQGDSIDSSKVEDSRLRLVELSLADVDDQGCLIFHRLVAEWVRLRGGAQEKMAVLDSLAKIASVTPADTMSILDLASIVPHLEVGTELLNSISPSNQWRLVLRLAQYYKHTGQYAKTLELCDGAIDSLSDHELISDFLYEAGKSMHRGQGRYDEALKYFHRCLDIRENSFDAENPKVAVTLNAIGQTLARQGKMTEAQNYYHRALTIKEKVYGSNHVETAITLNAIGQLLASQGQTDEALIYLDRALFIKEDFLDSDHPEVAISLSITGEILIIQGNYSKALDYFRRSLAIKEKVYGSEHSETAITMSYMGQAIAGQGQYNEAVQFLDQAVSILEGKLGKEHPFTKRTQDQAEAVRQVLMS